MQHCPRCGERTERQIPEGEDRERDVCRACGVVHYVNPKMVVGCVIEHEGKVLLCQRAIEPRRGYWTLPAGFLEIGESAMAGAVRETHEEARAHVRVIAPYAHLDVPHIGQIYLIYRARFVEPVFSPGPESLDVRLVKPDEIPWSDIAFPVVRYSLEFLVDDLRRGSFRTHHAVVVRDGGDYELRDHLGLTLAPHGD